MPALAAGSITLRDADTGLNVVTFSVDPVRYSPFEIAIRGSSHPVLSGSVIHQAFGLKQADMLITLDVPITDYSTLQDLWTKYRNQGGEYEMRDFFSNHYRVIFAPGQDSFRATPITGSCSSFDVTMVFRVLAIIQWFGGPY